MKHIFLWWLLAGMQVATADEPSSPQGPSLRYLDYSQREDKWSGGVTMIPVRTSAGTFRVWTKRVGNNPSVKVLLLHGGPGATHEYLEACDSYLPAAGIEYYYYDQLGSEYSDQPDQPELWELARFVEEVEQVPSAGLPLRIRHRGGSWGPAAHRANLRSSSDVGRRGDARCPASPGSGCNDSRDRNRHRRLNGERRVRGVVPLTGVADTSCAGGRRFHRPWHRTPGATRIIG